MGRNSRRQQRLEAEEELEEEDQSTDTATSPSYQNIFSSFTQNEDNADDDDEEEQELNDQNPADLSSKKRKPKKKKKKATTEATTDEATSATTTVGATLQSKQAPRVDEIDQALMELAEKLPHSISIVQPSHLQRSSNEEDLITDQLLTIDTRNLDHDLELRRMFGARVVSSTTSTNAPLSHMYGPEVTNNPHHHLNTKIKSRSSVLTKPEPLWPQLDKSSLGLSVRKLSPEEVESRDLARSDDWYKFEHAHHFRYTQSLLFVAIVELNPNKMFGILEKTPYHPDTLLQLSELYIQNDDRLQSIDFVNKALYVNEKVLNVRSSASNESSNSKSMTLGRFRLDYNFAENRNFFRALNFKLTFLIRQGCYKTALETCKLLFSLNPYQDPYGALFWIDFLAVKADQHEFFLKFLNNLYHVQRRSPKQKLFFEAFPGLFFAKAMCMRALEEKNHKSHEESDAALESAILRFPQVLKPLAEMIGISLPPKLDEVKILNVPLSEPDLTEPMKRVLDPHHIVHFASQIYAHRSFSLWKPPSLSRWFKSIVVRAMDKFNDFKHPDTRFAVTVITKADPYFGTFESVYRCVLASDSEALKKLLPQWASYVPTFSFDPISPSKGTVYDSNYFEGVVEGNNTTETFTVTLATRRQEAQDRDVEQEVRTEEEEIDYILSEEFDASRLVDITFINRLITRSQALVQIAQAHRLVAQTNHLLDRLHTLLNRLHEIDPPPDPELGSSELNADSETSFDHSHQMPGSFFNPNSDQ